MTYKIALQFDSLLTVALLLLKLSGTVNIGWLWVFSPLWIPAAALAAVFALLALIVIAFLIGAGVVAALS